MEKEQEQLPEGLHSFDSPEFKNLLESYVDGFAKCIDKEMGELQKNLEAIKDALSCYMAR